MRNVRTIAALGVAGVLATGVALVGMNSAVAAPPTVVATTPPSTSPSSPPLTDQTLRGRKRADTVSIYLGAPADGVLVAKVTAGKLHRTGPAESATLRIRAVKDFALNTGDFSALSGGHGRLPARKIKVKVAAGHTRTLNLRFRGATGPVLVWKPAFAKNGPHANGRYTWRR